MSKSTLSITVPATHFSSERTVEVPCRLPEAFNFSMFVPGHGLVKCAAYLNAANIPNSAYIHEVESIDDDDMSASLAMDDAAGVIFRVARQNLGMHMVAPPQCLDTLRAIALAYEAECAAHDAQVKALRELPRALQNPGLVPTHPSEREPYSGGAVGMLAQYVAWVFEQACDAQTKRAEQAAKVLPFPVTP